MKNRKKRRQTSKIKTREVNSYISAAHKALDEGDIKNAEKACQSAIRIDPLVADPHHLLAHIAYNQGRLQNAGQHILEAPYGAQILLPHFQNRWKSYFLYI